MKLQSPVVKTKKPGHIVREKQLLTNASQPYYQKHVEQNIVKQDFVFVKNTQIRAVNKCKVKIQLRSIFIYKKSYYHVTKRF